MSTSASSSAPAARHEQFELPFDFVPLVTALPDGGYKVTPKRVERREWISVRAAAGILGLSHRQTLRYIRAGHFEARQPNPIGGKIQLLRASVEAFVEGAAVGA